ncbi:MAG: mitochondrial fission ELM1 family protein [Rhodospirillaceae bacterium]
MTAPRIWVLPDGRPGNASQCLGVAEALGLPYEVKTLGYTWAVVLDNRLRGASLLGIDAATRATLVPPWPDLLITAGRRAAPVARYVKAQNGGRTMLVQLMHPTHHADDFDLIAVPHHDRRPAAPNTLTVTGAAHHVTPAKLAVAAELWRERLAAIPRPRLAVMIGGAFGRRPLPVPLALDMVGQVSAVAKRLGGGLLLTTSRRTPSEVVAALPAAIGCPAYSHFWTPEAENPYFGFLALSDAAVITGDSVSMLCEATVTERPVYILSPPGLARRRQALLQERLIELGHARRFEALADDSQPLLWGETAVPHRPLNAAHDIAAAIRLRLGW